MAARNAARVAAQVLGGSMVERDLTTISPHRS